ncbi:MAG: protein kinase [Verrucomicrobiales bacterium]|nr:protein kinase [Verrucomicrobiales bacterium]
MNPPSIEETLFHAAISLAPGNRSAYLDRACAGDPALRARLDTLLAAHDQPDTLKGLTSNSLLRPAHHFGVGPDPTEDAVGQTLGRYHLIERLGEGGCGVVYVAEQTEPVHRRVALKLIKRGMDSHAVIARFEAERQALAMMDHPNIAKVLDAGTTDGGRPYFVMELVRGVRINAHCDRNKLPCRERLDLFIKVCQAIQHAHQKGIIHRDIKPSNILVALHDGLPVPKVIDFGIAKAIEGRLTSETLHTQFNQLIGTPAYMSPEQAKLGGSDIDTRSDIYSLGVLLYELLTGVTPFDTSELLSQGLDAMLHVIRDKEPTRPSTRLTQLQSVRAGTASALRQPALASDLDWIVMKCLEKDRSRRYETANGLAADVRRHLANEPVVARPPSTTYRLQKAWHRNRLACSAVVAVVVALTLGAGIAALGWLRARSERDAALAAREAEASQRREAQAHAERAELATVEAKTANRRAEAELYRARLAQAQALLSGIRPRRREEALSAIAEAARIRPSFELRTEAITALALTDYGGRETQSRRFWNGVTAPVFDASADHGLGLLQPPGPTTNFPSRCGLVRLRDDVILREFAFRGGDEPMRWHLGENADWALILCRNKTLTRWAIQTHAPQWRETLDIRLDPWGSANLLVPTGGAEVLVLLNNGLGTLDGETGRLVRIDPVSTNATHFALSQDGSRVAFHLNAGMEVWDREGWQRLGRWPIEGAPHCQHFSSDGATLVIGLDSGEVSFLHIGSDLVRRLPAHAQPVGSLTISPDGGSLMTSSWDGLNRWWDFATLRMLGESRGRESPRFAAQGRRLSSLDGTSGVSVWSIQCSSIYRRLIAPLRANDGLHGLGFSADGLWLATGGKRGWDLWDMSAGRMVHREECAETPTVQFLGPRLDLLTSGGNGPRRWNFLGPTDGMPPIPLAPINLAGALRHAASRASYSPGSGLIAVAAGKDSLLCDPHGKSRALTLEQAHPHTVSVASSHDGRYVVTATWKGNGVSLFDGRSGKFLRRLSAESATIAFRPDSRHLTLTVAGGYEVLDTTTWQTVHSKRETTASGGSGPIAYSPDGRWLAMALDSRVIHLLDSETGTQLAVLTSPDPQNLFALAFSPDGQTLAAAVQTVSAIDLWDLRQLRRELADLRLDWAEGIAGAISEP